eukprot:365375-Chlamydomonas_euryale.AAC.8
MRRISNADPGNTRRNGVAGYDTRLCWRGRAMPCHTHTLLITHQLMAASQHPSSVCNGSQKIFKSQGTTSALLHTSFKVVICCNMRATQVLRLHASPST